MNGLNNWQLSLLGWYALNVLLVIGYIGKPRKPSTPGSAVFTMLVFAALAYVVVRA